MRLLFLLFVAAVVIAVVYLAYVVGSRLGTKVKTRSSKRAPEPLPAELEVEFYEHDYMEGGHYWESRTELGSEQVRAFGKTPEVATKNLAAAYWRRKEELQEAEFSKQRALFTYQDTNE